MIASRRFALAVLLPLLIGNARDDAAIDLQPVLGAPRAVVLAAGDTLLDVAQRERLGFAQLVHLNPGIDIWVPRAGTRVQLPTEFILPNVPREGLVINLPEMRLYDFTVDPERPTVLAVAIGDAVDPTPVGEYRIGSKRVDPVWTVPASIRAENPSLPAVVAAGPDNPLGDRWLTLGTSSYGIHGTNNVWSIGRISTHGCVRLYNDDMRALFERTKSGTRVRIVYQAVKLGQRNGELYVEAHPDEYDMAFDAPAAALVQLIVLDALGVVDGRSIDQDEVRRVIGEARGAPVRIGRLKRLE
jgi:L,D-transpeptidase ErfK/SrfK